ncbi:MAG: matrixin family metalloprotease [Chloroflexota bacterium]
MTTRSGGRTRARGIAALAAAVVLAALAPTAPAPIHAGAVADRLAGGTAEHAAGDRAGVRAAPDACRDAAYARMGGAWDRPWRWRFRAGSTPDALDPAAVEAVLRRAAANVVRGRNDCGRPDRIGAAMRYLGRTARAPGVTRAGRCGLRDGVNVVGFGRLPDGFAGITCVWTVNGTIIEADIRLARGVTWATTPVGCTDGALLESVATHEVGHVFGLGHVSEERHGRLTMSVRLDGVCDDAEATLGYGDLLGMEAIYGIGGG